MAKLNTASRCISNHRGKRQKRQWKLATKYLPRLAFAQNLSPPALFEFWAETADFAKSAASRKIASRKLKLLPEKIWKFSKLRFFEANILSSLTLYFAE